MGAYWDVKSVENFKVWEIKWCYKIYSLAWNDLFDRCKHPPYSIDLQPHHESIFLSFLKLRYRNASAGLSTDLGVRYLQNSISYIVGAIHTSGDDHVKASLKLSFIGQLQVLEVWGSTFKFESPIDIPRRGLDPRQVKVLKEYVTNVEDLFRIRWSSTKQNLHIVIFRFSVL